MWLNTLLLALRSIRRNLMRSFLTILGIVIGVSAVITMVTVGNGATLAVQRQISGLGTNLLQVRPGQRLGPGSGGSSAPAFKDVDADAIATQIGGVAAAAPESRSGGTLVANGRNWTSSITGSTNDWLTIGNWKLAQGRAFSDDELRAGAAVCLIGETVRRELFGSRPALGDQLRVKQISCEIAGVLASKGQGAFGNDQDDMVFMPIKTLQRRVTGNTQVNTLLVSMADRPIEAVVLAALGGLIGIVLATGASIGLSAMMGVPYGFNPGVNILSFLFSAGIGVLFGYFPARRAARLDPIDALRHE